MCQLTLVNLHNQKLNSLLLSLEMLRNSRIQHKDGYGFYGIKLFRSEKTPAQVTNFGELVKINSTSQPMIGHVRAATTTNSVKKICVENSHPFETNRFIFAHNGSLEFITCSRMREEKYKDMIDSQIFLTRLQEVADEFPEDTIDILLNKTYDEFRGKFAFLIIDKKTNTYYAIRGEAAKLYISFIKTKDDKLIGYIINTEEESLKETLYYFIQVCSLSGYGEFKSDPIMELGKESIFRIDPFGCIKLGDLRERLSFSKTIIYAGGRAYTEDKDPRWGGWQNFDKKESDFLYLLNKYNLTPHELDLCLELAQGTNLLSIENKGEITSYCELLEKIFKPFHDEKKSKLWDNIQYYTPLNFSLNPEDFYNKYGLQFPYFFNKTRTLSSLLNKLNKETK